MERRSNSPVKESINRKEKKERKPKLVFLGWDIDGEKQDGF